MVPNTELFPLVPTVLLTGPPAPTVTVIMAPGVTAYVGAVRYPPAPPPPPIVDPPLAPPATTRYSTENADWPVVDPTIGLKIPGPPPPPVAAAPAPPPPPLSPGAPAFPCPAVPAPPPVPVQ